MIELYYVYVINRRCLLLQLVIRCNIIGLMMDTGKLVHFWKYYNLFLINNLPFLGKIRGESAGKVLAIFVDSWAKIDIFKIQKSRVNDTPFQFQNRLFKQEVFIEQEKSF